MTFTYQPQSMLYTAAAANSYAEPAAPFTAPLAVSYITANTAADGGGLPASDGARSIPVRYHEELLGAIAVGYWVTQTC